MEIRKLSQIVHHVLSKSGYRVNYTWLIKVLYLADRSGLEQWDTAISEDAYCSMDQGPVLSGLYDLIRGKFRWAREQAAWDSRFYRDGYDLVSIVKEPVELDELSDREVDLIDRIEATYHNTPWKDMVDLLHDRTRFPEWTPPAGTSLPLPIEEILRALGRNDEDIRAALADLLFAQKESSRYPAA